MNALNSKHYSCALSFARCVCTALVLMSTLLAVGCSDVKPLMNQQCGTAKEANISIVLKHTGGMIYQAVVMNETIEFQLDPNKPPHQQIKYWLGVLLTSAVDIAQLNMSIDAQRVLESLRRCSTCSTDGTGCLPQISFDFKRFLLDEIPDLAWQHLPGKAARVINFTLGVAKFCGICPIHTPIPAGAHEIASISTRDNLSSESGAQTLYNTALFSSGSTVLRIRRPGETEFSKIVPSGDADGNGVVNAEDIRAILNNTNVACPLAVSRLTESKQTTDELLLQMLYMVRTGQFVPCSEKDALRIGRLVEGVLGKMLSATPAPDSTPLPGRQKTTTLQPVE
jgi:hypothetical protein